MREYKLPIVVSIILIVVVFLVLTPIIISFINPILYGEKIETYGIISEIKNRKDSDGEIIYTTYIKYMAENEEYIESIKAQFKESDIGKKIKIYYYKNKKEKIGIEEIDKNNLKKYIEGAMFFIILCLVPSIYIIIWTKKSIKKDKNLKEKGKIIFATIKELEKRTDFYRIICEWENLEDGKIYKFKTAWIKGKYYEINNKIKKSKIKEIPICVNKENLKEYKMDIEEINMIDEIECLEEMKNDINFLDEKEQIEDMLNEEKRKLEQKRKIDERNKYYQ